MRQKLFVVAMVLIVGLGLGLHRGRANQTPYGSGGPAAAAGALWSQPQPLDEFRLQDHTGAVFGPERLQDRWTLLFLGYTACPDICPTTLLTLRNAVDHLAGAGQPVPQVALVSVDPGRDDPETLGRYLGHFNTAFVGVRAGDETLEPFVRSLGGMYQREDPRADGGYDVAHSASIFVVDPQGRRYAVLSPPHSPAGIAQQLTTVRQRYQEQLTSRP